MVRGARRGACLLSRPLARHFQFLGERPEIVRRRRDPRDDSNVLSLVVLHPRGVGDLPDLHLERPELAFLEYPRVGIAPRVIADIDVRMRRGIRWPQRVEHVQPTELPLLVELRPDHHGPMIGDSQVDHRRQAVLQGQHNIRDQRIQCRVRRHMPRRPWRELGCVLQEVVQFIRVGVPRRRRRIVDVVGRLTTLQHALLDRDR